MKRHTDWRNLSARGSIFPIDIKNQLQVNVKYMNFVLQNEGKNKHYFSILNVNKGESLATMARLREGSGEGESLALEAIHSLRNAITLKADDIESCFNLGIYLFFLRLKIIFSRTCIYDTNDLL